MLDLNSGQWVKDCAAGVMHVNETNFQHSETMCSSRKCKMQGRGLNHLLVVYLCGVLLIEFPAGIRFVCFTLMEILSLHEGVQSLAVYFWPFQSLFIIDMCLTYEYRMTACCCRTHLARLSIWKPLVGCTSHTGSHFLCKCQCQSSVWHHVRGGRGAGGRSGGGEVGCVQNAQSHYWGWNHVSQI